MKKWGRRIRGAIGMGLTWAAAWFAAGILLARVSTLNPDLPFALQFAPLGFLVGVIFSVILVVLEGGRGFDRLSLSRFAGWGAASGLLLTGIFIVGGFFGAQTLVGEVVKLGLVLGTASAVCASGSLALARRAERQQLAGSNDDEKLLLGRSD